jgi:CheY-like chemotaxis protein
MKRLLVIDDEKDFLVFVKDVAEMQGMAVTTANSVDTAKRAYETCRPDIVLLDMVMPEADGLKFLQHMRDVGLRPRIIVTSGYHQIYTDLARKFGDAYELGPIQVLSKPISVVDLRKALQETDQAAA